MNQKSEPTKTSSKISTSISLRSKSLIVDPKVDQKYKNRGNSEKRLKWARGELFKTIKDRSAPKNITVC